MTTPEFSRPVHVDTLGTEPKRLEIAADARERETLAKRFALPAIALLEAQAELIQTGEEVRATGRMRAAVTQSCVASGEPLEAVVDEPFSLVFRPRPSVERPDEEVELSQAELDVTFYDVPFVDLGEAVAETLALALDPYPRAAGGDAALKAAGVKSEQDAGPFGALAALRDKMRK